MLEQMRVLPQQGQQGLVQQRRRQQEARLGEGVAAPQLLMWAALPDQHLPPVGTAGTAAGSR